jgi:hypothetical protein
MFEVQRKLQDGQMMPVASYADFQQAKRVAEEFAGLWPGRYIVQNVASGQELYHTVTSPVDSNMIPA